MPAETASERFLREQNLISTENKSMETQLRMLQKGGALTKAIAKTGGFLFGGDTVANGQGIQDAHDLYRVLTKQGDPGTSVIGWKALQEKAEVEGLNPPANPDDEQQAQLGTITPGRT